jgi:YVTN family beta-propeller protein
VNLPRLRLPTRGLIKLPLPLLVAVAVLAAGGTAFAVIGPLLHAGPQGNGTSVTTNGWFVTPAGRQVQLGERPYGAALSPDGSTLLVSNDGQWKQSLQVVDTASGNIVQTISYYTPEALWVGVAWSPDGRHAYASAGGNNKVRVYDVAGQHLTERDPIPIPTSPANPNPHPAGIAVSPDGKTLYAAENLADSVAIVDLATAKVTATVPVGHNPYTVALGRDGRFAFVSNWGASTVSVLATATVKVIRTIRVGTHPSALRLGPGGRQLYVANTDADSVSVIDTATLALTGTVSLAPYAGAPVGSSPNALAVSPDGATLYVANAGDNDVAVVDLEHASVRGLIPTAWYPTGLELSRDGGRLLVLNAKGLGAGPNPNGPNPYTDAQLRGTPQWQSQYVGSMIQGSLQIVAVPDADTLASYTQQVQRNDDFALGDQVRTQGTRPEQVIPRRVGDPSPIKHVIYVVKENRTYDQVLGDLGKGDGDPSLTLFDPTVTPNQHQLASRFVTLDNFYANAEVSADGWSWSTAAYANTYDQKSWPPNYGGRNRPYDFEGGNLASSPGRDPDKGYLWDRLDEAGVSYRNYGFWIQLPGTLGPTNNVAPTEPNLQANTDHAFPGYNNAIQDQVRVDEWLREFGQFEADGTLPTVELLRLPDDHTSGTTPGAPTPKAQVADNDLALGRVVEAVSHSRYWTDTAIFVVEDDAQAGPDHVDAHRTIAQVISPYTQTGTVDSTFYSTVAMLRTIELIVGVRPLTQFDAAAVPMLNAFTDTPNLTPYDAITPQQPLDEKNPESAPMAAVSAAQDLRQEDRINEQAFNQAIWKSVKGADSQMPAPVYRYGAAPTAAASRDADG